MHTTITEPVYNGRIRVGVFVMGADGDMPTTRKAVVWGGFWITSHRERLGKVGETEETLRLLWTKSRPPEGPFGPMRLTLIPQQRHGHDSEWGHLHFCGQVFTKDGGEDVRQWWLLLRQLIDVTGGFGMAVYKGVLGVWPEGAASILANPWETKWEEVIGDG